MYRMKALNTRYLNFDCFIIVYSSIQNYAEHYQSGSGGFEPVAFFMAVGDFVKIFSFSLIIGASMGCSTAMISFVNILMSNYPKRVAQESKQN